MPIQPGRPPEPRTQIKRNTMFRLSMSSRRQLAELKRHLGVTKVSLVESAIEQLHRETFPL